MRPQILIMLFLFSIAHFANAMSGGVRGGGGNLEEMDFKYRSTAIESLLTSNSSRVSEILGVQTSRLVAAIQSTNSECAKGVFVGLMERENKFFWFDRRLNTIFLDCRRYFPTVVRQSSDLVNGLILHEYARKIEGESSDYKISRHAQTLFTELAQGGVDIRGNIPERFAKIFGIALGVIDKAAQIEGQLKQIVGGNWKDEKATTADRIFCFTPKEEKKLSNFLNYSKIFKQRVDYNAHEKYSENEIPYNEWPVSYFKNSSDERCSQFKLGHYVNDPEMMEAMKLQISRIEIQTGYIVELPAVRAEYLTTKAMKNGFANEMKDAYKKANSELEEIVRSPTFSPLERALALAARKVLYSKVGAGQLVTTNDINSQALQEYGNTIAYLAFIAGDWLHETGGDLSIYREFDLEMKVKVLDAKVNYAINLAVNAMSLARSTHDQIDVQNRQNMIRSAVFWGIAGAVAWGTLVH